MGLFGGLGRFLQGKPVFEVPPPEQQQQQPVEEGAPGMAPQSGPQAAPPPGAAPAKPAERPVAVIDRTDSRLKGTNMEVDITVKNNSPGWLMMDKVRFMNITYELDTRLEPGQSREFTNVYRGPQPNNYNYNRAELQYHDETGNYVKTNHLVDFKRESDGTYTIVRFRVQLPVENV